ncbi:MAG: hypothetical protein ACLSWR_06430 [Ruthenibacterium sp.]
MRKCAWAPCKGRGLSGRLLWGLALAAAAAKMALCALQLAQATPAFSPIDDTLMFEMARSIREGNWLGEYGYLTLGKHSFFALWLAFLNVLHVNFLVGGQLLYAAACLVLLAAVKPLFCTNAARGLVFLAVLWLPASWAQFTLRVYRDNIYPALVLLALGGLVGAFCRFAQPAKKAVPYYVVAGAALAAAWLCHEDNALLLPFVGCAAAVYLVFLFTSKTAGQKRAKLALLLLPLALWAGGITAWKAMNYRYYGRFIVSDFSQGEFADAMGALTRVAPDAQQRYIPIPYQTRQMLYEISPTLASIQDEIENGDMYSRYGYADKPEFIANGIHWMLREAAANAGVYATPETARAFWQAVADEVNAACDAGEVPAGRKHSGVFSPVKAEYILPSLEKFGDEAAELLLFRQTSPRAELSRMPAWQAGQWQGFLHAPFSTAAVAGTAQPYFGGVRAAAYTLLDAVTWCMRVLVWPMLALAVLWLCRYVPRCVRGVRQKAPPADMAGCVLMLGLFLTGLLRLVALAYLFAVSIKLEPASLMYMSPAAAPMMAFLAFAAARWLEETFAEKAPIEKA